MKQTYRFVVFVVPLLMFRGVCWAEAGKEESKSVLPKLSADEQKSIDWALVDAAGDGDLASIKSALKSGANINYALDGRELTALAMATLKQQPEAVETLLAAGATLSTRTLFKAAYLGNLKIVTSFLDHGASAKTIRDRDRATLLHVVKNREVAELLIDRGADVNAKDWRLNTPLHFAAEKDEPDVVETLIKKKAEVNAVNKDGRTALNFAKGDKIRTILKNSGGTAKEGVPDDQGELEPDMFLARAAGNGNIAEIKSALGKGADINYSMNRDDDEGSTALCLAVMKNSYNKNQFETVKFLLSSGVIVTGLPVAKVSEEGNLKLLALLFDNGANANAPAWEIMSALHVAKSREVAEFLISKGANVNAKDIDSNTPLHSAAQRGESSVVEVLLKNKAKVNAKNKDGKMAFDVAKNDEVRKLIKDGGGLPGGSGPAQRDESKK